MNPNGKRMKLEATRLSETQRCQIIAKLSKPNALSKQVLGQEYEVNDGAIQEVMEMTRIEEEPPIDDEIHPIETFVEFESAIHFKGFEALLSLTLAINSFAPMFKRKLDRCMMNCDDRLRRTSEMLTIW